MIYLITDNITGAQVSYNTMNDDADSLMVLFPGAISPAEHWIQDLADSLEAHNPDQELLALLALSIETEEPK